MKNRLLQRTLAKSAFGPVSVAGTSAPTGLVIDRLGFDDAILVITFGANTTATGHQFTPVVWDADEAAFNVTQLAAISITQFGTASTLQADGTEQRFNLNLRGLKRYVKLILTPVITGGGGVIVGAAFIFGNKNVEPVDTTAALLKVWGHD